MARISVRRNTKLLVAAICCIVLYFMMRNNNPSNDAIAAVHLADHHPKLGDMKAIEEFWVPEKGKKMRYRGPGEDGEPVDTKPGENSEKDRAYSLYGFNQYVSDKISLHRTLPDTRHPACNSILSRRHGCWSTFLTSGRP